MDLVTSRQRGAALLLAALVTGRVLDRFDLSFERREPGAGVADSLMAAPAPAPAPAVAGQDVATPAALPAADAGEPVAINRVAAAELERLPGVGPVLAARIVAERQSGGRFRDPADLRRVRGIGAKTAARLGPRLRFD